MNSMVLKNKIILGVIGFGLVSILSACGATKAPDEFLVLRNPPLSLPPDFFLSPEGIYDDLNEEINPQEIAKRALFGEEQ
ncbi:MAG: DUF3035 domain-containing protein [Kordiimonadaceae bacterium]|jgi:hypothetical protein|nr:DUF3035 domain-containing protein [Kordiimonadaceae bacterium]MBT6032849.1 DUF3035 domain-containing protein [Kordiimonadaceae bacterium]